MKKQILLILSILGLLLLAATTVIGHTNNPPCSDHTVQEDHSMQEDSFTDPHTAQDTLPYDHTAQENEHTNQDSIDPGVGPK